MSDMYPTLDMIDRIGEPTRSGRSRPPLRVGDLLGSTDATAHCGGMFGRDFYGPGRVEAIGADWVLLRSEAGNVHLAADVGPEELCRYRDPR